MTTRAFGSGSSTCLFQTPVLADTFERDVEETSKESASDEKCTDEDDVNWNANNTKHILLAVVPTMVHDLGTKIALVPKDVKFILFEVLSNNERIPIAESGIVQLDHKHKERMRGFPPVAELLELHKKVTVKEQVLAQPEPGKLDEKIASIDDVLDTIRLKIPDFGKRRADSVLRDLEGLSDRCEDTSLEFSELVELFLREVDMTRKVSRKYCQLFYECLMRYAHPLDHFIVSGKLN